MPGDRRSFLDAAESRGADALIVDLEDAVPAAGKPAARETVAAWLPASPPPGTELWLRINADAPELDTQLITATLAGVVVPKAGAQLLAVVDDLLAQREELLGLPVGQFAIVALIETAQGLLAARELASLPRVAHLGLGEADLVAELRLRPSATREELAPLRLQLVVASAAAGIGAPIGPTSTDFRDLDALRASTEALLRTGFRARTAIHPAQLPVINEVFAPTQDEVAEARKLVDAFDRAGTGVITDADGRMVDIAVVRSARELLARVDR